MEIRYFSLEIRKKGGKSPDRLDTIVMLYADMPAPALPTGPPKRGGPVCGYVEDCFKQEDVEESVFGVNRFEE